MKPPLTRCFVLSLLLLVASAARAGDHRVVPGAGATSTGRPGLPS
jgi:hypothetical protein